MGTEMVGTDTSTPLISQTLAAEIEVSPVDRISEGVERVLRGMLEQTPQIALAAVILIVFVVLARFIGTLVRTGVGRATSRSDSFANVMSRLARWVVVAGGAMIALVIAVPSVNLAGVIGGLGIGTVAFGFAFKDIAQNTLAGLLLLFRRPFEIGDQIEVQGHTGTVEAITIRETRLTTYGGERILIPNAQVYSSSVRVQTAYGVIRSTLFIGVDYASDLKRAKEVALAATIGVEGVVGDPGPQALYRALNTSSVDFEIWYWTSSRQADICTARDGVVEAVTNALNDAGIGLPANVVELDARISFAEAIRLARGDKDFNGLQNGQSQIKPLPSATR
ncbi:mechanosensitive ion channel family protein [soil metagenome]